MFYARSTDFTSFLLSSFLSPFSIASTISRMVAAAAFSSPNLQCSQLVQSCLGRAASYNTSNATMDLCCLSGEKAPRQKRIKCVG